MGRSADRALRWFVGLSLLAGGLVLLAGAVQFGTLGGPIWVIPLAGVVAAGMAIFTAAAGSGPPSPLPTPAPPDVFVPLGVLLARADSAGDAFPSGFSAVLALWAGVRNFRPL